MSQRGTRKWFGEESLDSTNFPSANMKEDTRYLEQELIRQQEVVNQLTHQVQELEVRNGELSAYRDGALAELQEWSQIETVLRQKTEALARSNHELEQFAALAAHDLQEPLHSIQVFLDLLKVKHSSSLDEQGLDYLDRVIKACGRMEQLIESLLLYSRIDATRSQGAVVSLKQIMKDILSDLEVKIRELQAEIHVGELPMIRGDAVQMRHLFQNLIGNALKFHKYGVAPVLHISSQMIRDRRHSSENKSERLCQIEIEDHGIGIPEKHLNEIFGMFKRLHRRDEFEGTGIGLAVCQRIVSQCAGSLSVRSILGVGSTFIVTLPVRGD